MAIKDWPGGVVTDIPVEPSGNYEDSAASGVWTLDQVANYVKQDLWPTPGNVDPSKYVEGVFSTYLWAGNSTAGRVIVNDIDVSGEGGLVWIKDRTLGDSNSLFTTTQGANKTLLTNSSSAEDTVGTDVFQSFNSNGFTVGSHGRTNENNRDYVSWTFRKKEKFFDVVSGLTSDGSGNLPEFNHSLGSTPGCVIMKATDSGSNWVVYHSGLSGGGANQYIYLNATNAANNATGFGIATDTTFEVGAGSALVPDKTYIAYLFASDAGGFGDDGSESIIKCGSYTGNGSSSGPTIDLGFEPQWILIKGATSGAAYDWYLVDNMRGITTGGNDPLLWPNKSDAEDTLSNIISVTATGFKLEGTGFGFNRSGETYIYIAIRRPMKTPESGTEVFAVDGLENGTAPDPWFISNFVTDMTFVKQPSSTGSWLLGSRLTGTKVMSTDSTGTEASQSNQNWDYMNGVYDATANNSYLSWMFKRATGFFDVVAYSGTGSAHAEAHNLGVIPEMIIVKSRSNSFAWTVYQKDAPISGSVFEELNLNDTNAWSAGNSAFPATAPTSTGFYLPSGTASASNRSGWTYIAYLFATVAGVSKVGSYTGTGSNVDVDCGFSAGARFILIKRTDSSGDWYVWDSVRGIVAGNDPYLLLNSTAAEVTSTDYIDPLASGFTVTSSAPAALNASGGTYIFLAIA